MAEIVQSLFGITPEAYQQARQQRVDAQALQYAKLDPFEQANYAIGRGANMLGGVIGGALGGQDPELQRITEQSQMLRSLDINNPTAIMAAAQQANQIGNPQLAFTLVKAAEEAQKRVDANTSRQQAVEAQNIARGAYSPGGQPAFYGQETQLPLMDDDGNVQPGAGVTAASYDINRVAPELMRLGAAGQAQLLNASKVNEEMAKALKAQSDAVLAREKARNAPLAEQAAARKASADADKAFSDAETAAVQAKFAERLQAAGLNEKNWNIKNVQSQISTRAAELNLNAQTTAATVAERLANIAEKANTIPADTRKLVNESAVLAATSKQSANQMNDLASRIENLGGYGSFSRLSEFAKSTIGAEGYETSLRQEYTRIRNSAAIKALPPGPATDKDIELALSGFPKNTSDSKVVAQFLRGMAKLQDIDAAVSNAKTDWLAQNNGTLTRAGRTFIAGDFTVRPGESFNDFTTRVAKEVNSQYASSSPEARRQALIGQIPTNQPAQTPATRNIMSEADAILQRKK